MQRKKRHSELDAHCSGVLVPLASRKSGKGEVISVAGCGLRVSGCEFQDAGYGLGVAGKKNKQQRVLREGCPPATNI